MALNIPNSIVSAAWLKAHLGHKDLIIFDATMPKVTSDNQIIKEKKQIKGASFFDIKKVFSDVSSPFPNTVLSAKEFQIKAQEIGVNVNSCIVVYDDLGMYSSPRVWWLFQLMGFKNIAVLDGGFPLWKATNYPIQEPDKRQLKKGNFKENYQLQKIKFTKDVLLAINNTQILITDARSKGRFDGTVLEPRVGVKSGHIPNSVSLPFGALLENGCMKSSEKLKEIFKDVLQNKKEVIFSCGTGITASILALGAHLVEIENVAVYDGSWTEWGSTSELPIEM
jgi:thiosulfate/3-mercaptopyruvate sulfurtransferase